MTPVLQRREAAAMNRSIAKSDGCPVRLAAARVQISEAEIQKPMGRNANEF
jgi:hypothetical protein